MPGGLNVSAGWIKQDNILYPLQFMDGPQSGPDTRPYDVIVGLIQSNVRGAATDWNSSDQYNSSLIDMWHWPTSSVISATEPLSSRDAGAGMGVLNTFVKDYAANSLTRGRKILIVNAARGGTGFTLPSTASGNSSLTWDHTQPDNANNLAITTKTALETILSGLPAGSRIVALVANHGSTDGINNTPKATFKALLGEWITWFRTQLDIPEVPYLMMQMRPSLFVEPRHYNLDQAQQEIAADNATYKNVVHVASPDGDQYNNADVVHFNALGVRTIGHSLYQAYEQIIEGGDGHSSELAGALPIGTASYAIPGSNVLYVATNGNNSNPGTLSQPKATVAGAISAASTGATIVVRGGTYNGTLGGLTKDVTIQNYPLETVWFDGQNNTQHTATVRSAVKIRGVGFRRYNVTNDATFERGLVIPSAGSNTVIENCHFEDFGANVTVAAYNGTGPMNIFGCSDVTVRLCTFKRSGVYHIYTNRTTRLVIENCYFLAANRLLHNPQPVAAAIKHCRAFQAVIRHNVALDNQNCQAFWLDVSCYDCDIYGNNVAGGYEAILVELSGTVRVVNNFVSSGTTYGVRVLCSSEVTAGWNQISGTSTNPHIQLGVLQDERYNTGSEAYIDQGVTWIAANNKLIGNILQGNFAYGQIGVYDYTAASKGGPKRAAVDMITIIAGNQYNPRPGDGRNESFQWSHTAGQAFSGRSLTQLIAAHPTKVQRANVNITAEVATLLGVEANKQYLGPILPAPVLVESL